MDQKHTKIKYTEIAQSRHLSNVRAEHKSAARQAAKETGFAVWVGAPTHNLGDGFIGVYSHEPTSRDHGPFWDRYRELVAELTPPEASD